ncbi:MAG: zf-HC2 domain-containing protein [Peptococcaceae bacterium]|nr:zf-HC2 domain-containing protein [Peptococcaceae bacterium]
MKYELPCDIVKDLLPNYIDGLTNDSSTESVEAHLKKCGTCKTQYEEMVKIYQAPAVRETIPDSVTEEEKTLFRKINHTVNKKVRKTACAGIVGIILALVIFHGLFNMPFKEVSVQDLHVTAHVYDMTQMQNVDPDAMITMNYPPENTSVVISKGENVQPGDLITITIPDNQNVSYQVTEAVLADCPYVTSVEFCSPYYLRKISWDYLTENGQRIMYINDIRTSILNNKVDDMNVSSATIDFSKVDKIVYVDDDGSKTILWENET